MVLKSDTKVGQERITKRFVIWETLVIGDVYHTLFCQSYYIRQVWCRLAPICGRAFGWCDREFSLTPLELSPPVEDDGTEAVAGQRRCQVPGCKRPTAFGFCCEAHQDYVF